MAISQTSLSTSRAAGQAGHVTDHNTGHQAIDDLTTIFNGWQTTDRAATTAAIPTGPAPSGGDDTSALQTFLTANSGRVVRLPPNGSYSINGSFTVGNRTWIDGQGSLLTQTSASKIPIFDCNGTDGFTVSNMRAQGNASLYDDTTTVYPAAFVRARGSAKNIRVLQCIATGFAGPILYATDTDGVYVSGCTVVGVGGTFTFVAAVSKDNACVILDGATTNVFVTDNNLSLAAQGVLGGDGLSNVHISGNTIHDIGGQNGVYLNQVVSAEITGNIVRNTAANGIKVQTTSGLPDATGVAVTGNTIDTVGAHGIIFTCASNAVPSRHRYATVTGNTVHNASNDGVVMEFVEGGICTGNLVNTARAGIRVTDFVGGSVKGNRVTSTSQDGILVSASAFNSSGAIIGQNDILNPGTANGATTEFGIRLAEGGGFTLTDVTLDGNRIVDLLGNARYLIYNSTASQTAVTYRNNHGYGATDYGHRGPATKCREWVGNNLAGTSGRFHTAPSRESVGDLFLTTYSNAAPATGTWVVGDRCWNDTPTSSSTPGWVCTASGTPGTWSQMPVIGTTTVTPNPSNFNMKGWTSDPAAFVSGGLMTAATHYVEKVFISGAQTVTNVVTATTVAAATAANAYVALYDSSGNLIAGSQSADVAATWNAAAGVKSFALGTPAAVTNDFVYVSVWINSAGTMPTTARSGSGTVVNLGTAGGVTSATSPRIGTSPNAYTSSGTVAPATLGSISTAVNAWVLGLS